MTAPQNHPIETRRPEANAWFRSFAAGTVIWLLSLFMASPPFASWSWQNISVSRAADYLRLCEHPVGAQLVETMLSYRLTVPGIAWLLHLPPRAALALPFLFAWLAVVVMHRAVVRRSSDPWFASALVAAVACSSTLHYAHALLGVPDGFTHLAAALCLILPAPAAAVATALGALNDERIVLALPFVVLWRLTDGRAPEDAAPWRRLPAVAAPFVAGLLLALLARHALRDGWIGPGFSPPRLYDEQAATLREVRPWLGSWGVWFANWLNGGRWLWMLVLAPLCSRRWRPTGAAALLLAAGYVLACASTFVVADSARSIGFAFSAALVAGVCIHERDRATARRMALAVAALQVVTPAVWIYQNWQFIQFRPFPWELWLYLHTQS